jgi:hypothetical protein
LFQLAIVRTLTPEDKALKKKGRVIKKMQMVSEQ